MADLTANLEAMLAGGADNAALRVALATRYLAAGKAERAIEHANSAVDHDADYSAAWRVLGKALTAAGRDDEARRAYERGIGVAERRGDQQAAKEMRVFLKRLLPRA
ncbi:tetratricopeptide repeat protein [Candidatus Rariloculus sp.]|uniref:tetratricopeptide repeat protein n=1 Tax=Candidatus Rariloculus sp. TaxID=3101265 RepID=UPI003D0C52F7